MVYCQSDHKINGTDPEPERQTMSEKDILLSADAADTTCRHA